MVLGFNTISKFSLPQWSQSIYLLAAGKRKDRYGFFASFAFS